MRIQITQMENKLKNEFCLNDAENIAILVVGLIQSKLKDRDLKLNTDEQEYLKSFVFRYLEDKTNGRYLTTTEIFKRGKNEK
jgi:hypothetical protein